MKFYNQTDLFAILTSAAGNRELKPDAAALGVYKEKRLARAVKALRSRNVFLYTEGTRTSLNFNNTTTVYTQPTGVRLLVCGYGNNLRYGTTTQSNGVTGLETFPQEHRLRVVGPNGQRRVIVEDLTPSQAGVVGEARYTTPLFPAPFILEAGEQLALDLGYDTAADSTISTMPSAVAPEAFIFFCVKVRDRLTADDYRDIETIRYYIATHDYQRPVYLNCVSLGVESISFDSAIAGGVAVAETRPANGPLLITGIATSLGASKLTITDTGTGHSFSLDRPMQSSALMMPDQDNNPATAAASDGAPAVAPVWTEYFEFPVPHLLFAGNSLRCDLVNGGRTQTGATILDAQTGNVLLFQGVSI